MLPNYYSYLWQSQDENHKVFLWQVLTPSQISPLAGKKAACTFFCLKSLPSMMSLQFNYVIPLFSSVGILTRYHTFVNLHYILIIFQPINICLSKVEYGTLTTAGCLVERLKHVTCISQSDMPKKNETGSEQCNKTVTHWEMCVMINIVSLQHWQRQSSCHLVLNVIGAELWWQQEKVSRCG